MDNDESTYTAFVDIVGLEVGVSWCERDFKRAKMTERGEKGFVPISTGTRLFLSLSRTTRSSPFVPLSTQTEMLSV